MIGEVSEEKKRLVLLSFIGSLLITISGFIFLYIAIRDEELNVEYVGYDTANK